MKKDMQIFDEATGEPIKKSPTISQLQAFLKAKKYIKQMMVA
jgi:hypothetical protein